MFKKKESAPGAAIDTLVSAATRIQGDVAFSGGLHLDGQVAGSVKAEPAAASRLVVSRSAVVEGSVRASVVEVEGVVRGDIEAPVRVVLGPAARVEGNLHYGAIEMAAGARINGKLVKLGTPESGTAK
ncbi:MAG: polymer-forming cytoskeletal protein [Steroidobacteraceae bacterium]